MSKIKRIRGISDDLEYMVGLDGVTSINQGSYSPEPHCERRFYQVYKGSNLYAIVNDQGVTEIVFFPMVDAA